MITLLATAIVVVIAAAGVAAFLVASNKTIQPWQATSDSAAVEDPSSYAAQGDSRLVTRCGRPPTFRPTTMTTDSGGLQVTMRVTANCPDGDVLATEATRISIVSNGADVASATFDYHSNPLTLPPPNGGTGYVTQELHYPLGTFWRVPASLSATGQSATGTPGTDILVECERTGAVSAESAALDTSTPQPLTAAAPAAPTTGDAESASFQALRAIADIDRPVIARDLADRWVPQLSTKRPGLFAEGIVWNNTETLREHLALRLRYPDARLLWTGEWSTFSASDFWVTIAGNAFPDPGGAVGWCDANGYDADHCFAKLVSTIRPVEGSTVYR